MISSVVPATIYKKRAERRPKISHFGNSENPDFDKIIIEKVINKVLSHLPSLTTIAVVEVATGICLAHLTRIRCFDPAAVAACHAEMVRQKQLVMVALDMRGERLEDILIPFRKQLHLIRVARHGQWFMYLVVKAQDTSLALAREVLKSIIT